jgi:PAS domain S-box-containing protein
MVKLLYEDFMHLLFQNSTELVCIINQSGDILKINSEWKNILGYHVSELLKINFLKLIHPEEILQAENAINQIYTNNKVRKLVNQFRHKNGTFRWIEWNPFLLKDSIFMQARDISEKILTENALKKSEQRFSQLFKNMTNAFVLHKLLKDEEGNYKDIIYVEANAAAEKLFNLPRDKYIGKSPYEIFQIYDDKWIKLFDKIASTGQSVQLIHYSIYNNKYYEIYAYCPEKDYCAVITNDITEKKINEEKITEKDTLLKNIFKVAPVGIGLAVDRKFVEINDHFCKMTGYTSDELINKDVRMLYISDEEYNYSGNEQKRQFLEKKIESIEVCLRKKDGSVINTILRFIPLDPTDISKGFAFSALDITQRKKDLEALKKRVIALTQPLTVDEKNIQLTDLFNVDDLQKIQDTFASATGVASIITYPDGKPITQPSNFCELCKMIRKNEKGILNCYKSDAYIGHQNISGPTIQPCYSGGLWDAGASITLDGIHIANWLIGQVRNDELDMDKMVQYAEEIGIDKQAYQEALNKVPVMSKQQFKNISESLFILANELSLKAYQNVQQARFISEQEKSKEEIRKLNAELESRVKERTHLLEQAYKDMEAFSYSISHDLKAPLRHIKGFVSMLYSSIDSPQDNTTICINKINNATSKMSSMIEALLDFSRLGRKNIVFKHIILSDLIEEIVHELKPDYADRDIEWKISALPEISGDSTLLKIAFENLVSNAIKYTYFRDIGRIEIGIKHSNNKTTTVYIKDNGAGFDMKYIDKLFGVFQRLHPNDEFEGVGIGLANTKQIINKHNGTISAESIVNKGTTFYVTLNNA